MGTATAYAIVISGLVNELVLVDINRGKAEGEAMDIAHGASFVKPVNIYAGDFSQCRDADIIIYTAGAAQKPGETRLDLAARNTAILKETLPEIIYPDSKSILLVVANPVDVLTYAALKIIKMPPGKVLGSGTVLDTSRFRYLISRHCLVEPRNIHAHVAGEHGDSEVLLWSTANIAGISIDKFCARRGLSAPDRNTISSGVRHAAYEVIGRKGYTCFAIGLAVKRICECILRDENSILTVSGLLSGEYGLNNLCMSLPSIVNREGRAMTLEVSLAEDEKSALQRSAQALRQVLDSLKI